MRNGITFKCFFKEVSGTKVSVAVQNFSCHSQISRTRGEGNWTDYYTDQPMQHNGDFAPGELNGEERQNCVLLRPNGLGWADYYCDSKRACLCDHKPTSYVSLTGLSCKKSAMDTT